MPIVRVYITFTWCAIKRSYFLFQLLFGQSIGQLVVIMTDLEAGAAYFHFSCHSISTKLHPSFTYHISLPTSLLFCQFSLAWSKLLFLYEDSVDPPFKKNSLSLCLLGYRDEVDWPKRKTDKGLLGGCQAFPELFLFLLSQHRPLFFFASFITDYTAWAAAQEVIQFSRALAQVAS